MSNDRKNRTKPFLHLESQIRGVLEALYTFLVVKRGKGIGESNQGLKEWEEALLKAPFILRLFIVYFTLIMLDTGFMKSHFTQRLFQWVMPSKHCPAWYTVVRDLVSSDTKINPVEAAWGFLMLALATTQCFISQFHILY